MLVLALIIFSAWVWWVCSDASSGAVGEDAAAGVRCENEGVSVPLVRPEEP